MPGRGRCGGGKRKKVKWREQKEKGSERGRRERWRKRWKTKLKWRNNEGRKKGKDRYYRRGKGKNRSRGGN